MERFSLRRAVERLRDGLFDREAVSRLTVEEEQIKNHFSTGLKALEGGKADHLCICGSYGQGKSHTLTYLNQWALSQGFATSIVPLDIREVPFHQFSAVYQSLMERLSLPDGKKFTEAWRNWAEKGSLGFLEAMPHRFKMILTAMLNKNKQLSPKEMSLKQHCDYQPKEYEYWLEEALMGHDIPLAHLKSACKYREVEGFRDQSLLCRGNDSYFQMVQSLGKVLHEMGYKGLLLFFDEAESITQGRFTSRTKSYLILDQFFQSDDSYVFPIFAFTEDFFEQVKDEPYDDDEWETFPKNYAEAWKGLNIVRLQNFSSKGWESLLDRLMHLYSEAYQIALPQQVKGSLLSLLNRVEAQETRFKLKALVNKLDIETQQVLLDAGV